jgi:hypothetical protein
MLHAAPWRGGGGAATRTEQQHLLLTWTGYSVAACGCDDPVPVASSITKKKKNATCATNARPASSFYREMLAFTRLRSYAGT